MRAAQALGKMICESEAGDNLPELVQFPAAPLPHRAAPSGLIKTRIIRHDFKSIVAAITNVENSERCVAGCR